jgi:hypothetical protein
VVALCCSEAGSKLAAEMKQKSDGRSIRPGNSADFRMQGAAKKRHPSPVKRRPNSAAGDAYFPYQQRPDPFFIHHRPVTIRPACSSLSLRKRCAKNAMISPNTIIAKRFKAKLCSVNAGFGTAADSGITT